MPTYDYKCTHCGHIFEELQSIKETALTLCPKCGKETLIRLIGGGGGVIFKGSGFYLTDYKGASGKGSSASSPSAPASKKETKPSPDSSSPAPSTPKG
ncbi:MAG: zinc ribbon domain-containing protein [Bacteroidota bacterium]